MLRIGASSGAQVLRTIAGIPSGPLDLEVSSWRRVWRTFRVENLMGDIVNFDLANVIEKVFHQSITWDRLCFKLYKYLSMVKHYALMHYRN